MWLILWFVLLISIFCIQSLKRSRKEKRENIEENEIEVNEKIKEENNVKRDEGGRRERKERIRNVKFIKRLDID